jgi:hypothetical protein
MKLDPRKRAVRSGCHALALAGTLLALSGCANWSWRGPGFNDEPKIGRKPVETPLAPNQGASLYGYSTKARQIEQNLGVE